MNKNFKKIIATVAALAMASSSFVAMAATYPDVTPDANYYSAVEQLSALGIMEGFDDGTFKPEEKVTRAQMAKLVVGAKNLLASAESNTTVKFDDVKADHWAVGYVAEGVAQQIINGTSDTTFDPEATVTFAQATKMLVNAAGYEAYAQIAGGWPNGYLTWGSELGVNKGITGVGNDTELTRAQVAQMLINAMKAPVLIIDKYTPDNGQMVPTYVQKDGEDGRKFESLLTNEWDTYEVYGKVDGTSRSSNTIKAGKVDYLVDKSKNFDGAAYTGKYLGLDQLNNPVYSEADVNGAFSLTSGAEDFYLEYTYALINVNDDEEASIVYIESAGKSVYQEMNNKLYVDNSIDLDDDEDANRGVSLELYKSESSTSKKVYNLSSTLKLIVNGVEVLRPTVGTDAQNAAAFEATIENYLDGSYENAYLVDTVSALTPSTDKVYDYLILDAYRTGVVSEVIAKKDGDVKVITNNGNLEISADDEETAYSFVLTDGTELEATDLQKNDVLSIQTAPANLTGTLPGASFYNVIVSRDTAEGKVTAEGTNAAGKKVYTIGDAEYELIGSASVNMLESYTLYLDKDGKVAKADLLASSVNYAIVDRYFTSAGETKVRLILKDGSKVDYAINSDTTGLQTNMNINEQYPLLDGGAIIASTVAAVADNPSTPTDEYVPAKIKTTDRFVKYSVNKSNEVTLTALTAAQVQTEADKYNERTGRIGSYGVSDTAVILNAIDFASNTAEAVTVVDKSVFVDQMSYTAVFVGTKNQTDSTYPMVVMLTGDSGYTINSELQVAAGKVKQVSVDGEQYSAIPVYAEDGTTKDLLLDSAATVIGAITDKANIVEGTPFVAKTNAKGEVEQIWALVNPANFTNTWMLANANTIAEPTPITFNGETGGKTVSFIVAPVIKKYEGGISFTGDSATDVIGAPTTSWTDDKGDADPSNDVTYTQTSDDTGVFRSYAATAKAYSYDAGVKAGNRVSLLDSVVEVTASVIADEGMVNDKTLIDWTSTNNDPAYAIARIYDGDIQEIYSIVLN